MEHDKVLYQFRQMETFCFKSFSSGTDKPWGTMFYNPDILERHDANHAEIIKLLDDTSVIINDISEFYNQKGATIRINFYDPDDDHPFKLSLAQNRFDFLDKSKKTTIMRLNKYLAFEELINERDSLRVTLSHSLPLNSQIGEDIVQVIHSEWFYQNIVTNENYYYFILYDNNTPVSVLSFFLYEPFTLARLDDVVTLPDKRNNGYATFLLKFACNWVQNNDFTPYLIVTNPVAKKIYEKIGFEEIFSCTKVHWIKET